MKGQPIKAVLLVDYNEHYRKGDAAPAQLAAKLVKAGLAKAVRPARGKKPKAQGKTDAL